MHSSSTTYQGLARLRDRGFAPDAILDVGAHAGVWARGARSIWPGAHIVMVDALQEKETVLRDAATALGNADVLISFLGDVDAAETTFYVVNAGEVQTGSSKYREQSRHPIEERHPPQRRLDSLLDESSAFAFVKLDVQGSELDILRGATRLLADTEVVLMEVSAVAYNDGAPLAAEVLAGMGELGFVLFDLLDEFRIDGRLFQFDALFIRPDSAFRPQPPF